jgi:hypothetical protein
MSFGIRVAVCFALLKFEPVANVARRGGLNVLCEQIGRQDASETEALSPQDYMRVDLFVFPPKGNNKPPRRTPPHSLKHTFKFKVLMFCCVLKYH